MLLVRHINMFFQFYDIEKDKGTIVMLDGKTVTPLICAVNESNRRKNTLRRLSAR